MLYSERIMPQSASNTNHLRHSSNNNSKYEYISDKLTSLQNNSTSSSISSSNSSTSSAANSSLNGSNTYIEPKYNYQINKPANQIVNKLNNPVYNSPRFNYLTLSPNIKRNVDSSQSNNKNLKKNVNNYCLLKCLIKF